MKQLKNCYDEIYKCSKCGLCQGVCPIFKITKNEAALSRGKFLMLLKYLEGKFTFSKTMSKYLDMCTFCGACSKFCPSDIDAQKIFTLAKFEQKNLGQKISEFFLKLIFNSLFLIRKMVKIPPQHVQSPPQYTLKKGNIIFFEGCFSKIFNQKLTRTSVEILQKMNFNVITPNFNCCGIVAQSAGAKALFEEQIKKNIAILKENSADYIVFDCASCLETVKNYDKYLQIDDFDKIKEKCISILEFLQLQNVKFKSPKKCTITYHKPCHLDFDTQELLRSIENVDYIKMNDFDKCCGFSGKFAISNNKIANEMFKNKAENISNTSAELVLTFCPSCILGLKACKKYTKKKFKIINIVEFLEKLEIIS